MKILKENISAWAQYSVLHPRRDEIISKLKENGIPTAIYYPIPLHQQKAFAGLNYQKGDFPIAEKIACEQEKPLLKQETASSISFKL